MISVVIPTYNCAKYLPETIKSVLKQSYKDFEIIVVDDGSDDNTKEVLRPYTDEVKYITQPNRGASHARNVGVKEARGEWVAFLDADDLWVSEKLKRQVDYIKSHPAVALVFSRISYIDEQGVDYPSTYCWTYRTYSGKVFEKLLIRNFVITSTVVAKRECLLKVGGFNPRFKYSQDYELWLKMARHYDFGCIDSVLVKYRIRSTGLTKAFFDKMYKEHIEIVKWMADLFPELNLTKSCVWKKGLSQHYFEFGKEYFHLARYRQARKEFLNSLGYGHFNGKSLFYLGVSLVPRQMINLIRNIR